MKTIAEIYGELTISLVVAGLMIAIVMTFVSTGSFSDMVAETVDTVLGNTQEYGEQTAVPEPEAVWTGGTLPVGVETRIFSYIQVKTGASEEWVFASKVQEAGFEDFTVEVEEITSLLDPLAAVDYDEATGIVVFTSAGIYQVELTVTDKEKRSSRVLLRIAAE